MMTLPPISMEALAAQFMRKKALDNHRQYDVFHPSDWGYCLRKVAFQYYNEYSKFQRKEELDIDIKGERIYDNGHDLHARWRRYLDGAGVLRGAWRCLGCDTIHGKDEPLGIFNPSRDKGWICHGCSQRRGLDYEELAVESDPRYNFAGHVDAIVDVSDTPFETKTSADIEVVDFKSIKGQYFDELQEAKPEHAVQIGIYMWLLDLDASVIVYENKDSQAVKEFFVARDDKKIEEIKCQAEWLLDVLRHKRLPPRPSGYGMSKYPCRFCEFLGRCYA
jgi:hypothetical protein